MSPLSTSRDEFLHADALEYGRKGGCFVSTGRALAFVFAAVLFAALVGVLVYYFGVATRKAAPVAQAATNGTGAAGGGGGGDGGGGGPQTPPPPAPASARLSGLVRPSLYQLHLKPHLGDGANFTFVGHAAITIRLAPGAAPQDTVVLHAKQLNISADEVAITVDSASANSSSSGSSSGSNSSSSGGAGRPTVVSQRADPAQETYSLSVSPPLQPGQDYVLEIPFRGQLRDSLTGFYRTSYQEGGRTKWMALTQFEATDARAAFPCFDEPGMKARFQISIAHSTNYTAVSNMPVVRTEQIRGEPGWVVDHFDTTPPMSTYLVAFVVSEMVFETVNDSVQVMTTPQQRLPAATTPPAGTASSATARGKSLSTGFSTDSGAVDTIGTNATVTTSVQLSAADTGLSSRYTVVSDATSHEQPATVSGTPSLGGSGSPTVGSSPTTAHASSPPNVSDTASGPAAISEATASPSVTSSGTGRAGTVETASAGSSSSVGTDTSSSSAGTSVGTPPVGTITGTALGTPASSESTGAPIDVTVTRASDGAPTSYTSSGTVSHSGSNTATAAGSDTSSASQNASSAMSSGAPATTGSSAPGSSAETSFTATSSDVGTGSSSVVNVTSSEHSPAVTTASSGSPSPAVTTATSSAHSPTVTTVSNGSPLPAVTTSASSAPGTAVTTVSNGSPSAAVTTAASSAPGPAVTTVSNGSPSPAVTTAASSAPGTAVTTVSNGSPSAAVTTAVSSAPGPAVTTVSNGSPSAAVTTAVSSAHSLEAMTVSSGSASPPVTTAAAAVPTDGITALPLTGGSTTSRRSRFATAVFVPSTSQVGTGRTGNTLTGGAGTSEGLTGLQANTLARRKRQVPAANATGGVAANGTAVPLPIRMIVRPHLREQAHYALSITPKILNFYADYFGIAYPLPKLDFAAIPDFQYGGMENWGLITYWETQVLIGPETTTDSLEKVAATVVHELGHQWFGNLVTPTWWTDIWLNEGFATYLEYLATDFIEPTWEMIDKFVNDLHDVMSVDSMQSTHPVSNAVGSAAQILQAFDEISYTKGACLIRMLNHSLTEPVFRRGLLIYIDKWKYSNAKQDDLWWSMEEAATSASLHEHALPQNATVKQVMDSWTLQPGFPVVTAIRDYVNGSVTINQTRFTTDGRPVANSSSQAWYIPVSFATQDDVRAGNATTRPRVWLGAEEGRREATVHGVLPPGAPGAAKWLLLNLQQTGYFRVNYDAANWELLVRQLATAPLQLPTATRAQLVSDALALARAGALRYGVALNLTRYLRDSRAESSLVPWEAFLDGTLHLEAGLALTPTYVPLKRYLLSVVMPLLERLRLDPQPADSLPTRQLRARALARALRLEARNVTDWAERLFARWMAAPSNYSVPVDLRPTVYCAAVMEGGEAEFNFAMEQFRNTTDPAQQRILLTGLMCSRQPSLVAMLLNAPLEGKIMRVQDALTVWRAVPRNPVARAIAFDYIREHWSNLTKRFPDTDFPIKDMLEGATAGLSTQVQLDDLKAFREAHKGEFAYTSAAIERAIESLQEVVSWTRRFEGDIAQWLDSPAAAVAAPRGEYRAEASSATAARPSTPVAPTTSTPHAG